MPRVSVVIPNYNHARYLRKRVGSVLGQTYRNFEVIILDDASTDDSLAVLSEFESDPRVRLYPSSVNSGNTFKQWNKGAALATGEYLWFAESDDYADERFLERLVIPLEQSARCGLACCESWYVFDDGVPTGRTNDSHLPENARWRDDYIVSGRTECAEQLVVHNTMPNASALVLRRSVFEQVGRADESMRLCGDWLLWVRMLAVSDLAHIGEPLNFYRCHTAAVRKQNRSTANTQAEVYKVIDFIVREMGVRPEKLERVLAARSERFIQSAWDQHFSARDVWTVYRAAQKVDRRAWRRILLRWCRWQAGAARRRLLGMHGSTPARSAASLAEAER